MSTDFKAYLLLTGASGDIFLNDIPPTSQTFSHTQLLHNLTFQHHQGMENETNSQAFY